jgi:hypothetical protein
MANARIEEAPDDASLNGVIRERLREFAGKVKYANGSTPPVGKGVMEAEDRSALMRGLPVVCRLDEGEYMCFRAQDFINYLKRTKSEEIKGANMWFALVPMGIEQRRIRIDNERTIRAWTVPWDKVNENPHPERPKVPKPEL